MLMRSRAEKGELMESISGGLKNYKEVMKGLEDINKDSETAIKRTISDFKSRAPGWVSKAVTDEYTIKKSEVNSALSGATKAGSKKVKGREIDNLALVYKGRPLTPTHFKMNPKKPSTVKEKNKRLIPGQNVEGFEGEVAPVQPIKQKLISVEVHKGQARKLTGKYGDTPFLQTNGSTGFIPFQRKTDDRKSMVSIKSTSAPQMITNEKTSEEIYKSIDEGLSKRLEHHVEQALKKR